MSGLFSSIASSLVTTGISKLILGDDDDKSTESVVEETKESSDFDALLKNFLPADNNANVSEEELFSAAAGERINALKGAEGLKAYQDALAIEKQALTRSDGFVETEQATINALNKLVADGVISAEEGDSVYTDSFAAAQLDDNKDTLFDNRGSDNDPSVAVAKMSEVMQKIKSYMENIETTRSSEPLKSLASAGQTGSNLTSALSGAFGADLSGFGTGVSESGAVVPNGTYVDGSEGFLFKPITDNDGRLGVLFDQSWTYNLANVRLLDQSGNLVEDGLRTTAGIAETGREKFIFSKKGGDYQDNLTVEVTFKDGAIKTYAIADPSKRYD